MLSTHSAARKRSTRHPFLVGLWDDHHPDFQRIDSELEPDHHARWLQAAVARLDLAALRRAYSNCGSLAYPVELLLAFVLFMYSKKLTSPASWVEESRKNDAGKWLLLGLKPCRSTFYTFRNRLEPFLDSFHKTFIDWAKAESITSALSGSLDGTFLAALASRHRLLSCRVVDGRVLLLLLAVAVDKRSDQGLGLLVLLLVASGLLVEPIGLLLLLLMLFVLLQQQREAARRAQLPGWLPASVAGRERMLKRLEKAQQRQHERLKPLAGKKRLSKKDEKALRVKINPSDPEAALGFDKRGTYRPLYNLQLVKATDANLILAWELYSRNNDDGLLKPMMEQMFKQTGQHLEEALVDGAFVSIGDLLYCEKHSITVYAPPAKQDQPNEDQAKPDAPASTSSSSSQPESSSPPATVRASASAPPSGVAVGQPEGDAEQKKKSNPTSRSSGKKSKAAKKYGKEKFRYDSEKKEYQCPAGKVLKEVFRTSEKRIGGMELPVLVHRAEASDCQGCAQRSQCTSGKQGRVVKRYEGEEVLERLAARMAEPANQEIYRLRSQTVEPGYGELKTHRGLDQLRCFESKRSRCQVGLTVLANNALSIVRALLRRDKEPKPPPN